MIIQFLLVQKYAVDHGITRRGFNDEILSKIQMHEAQKSLLTETINNGTLLKSKIMSSLQPSVGRTFINEQFETRKTNLLLNTRKKLMQLAVNEKEFELQRLNNEFDTLKRTYLDHTEDSVRFLTKMEQSSHRRTQKINERMNKKVNFHLQRQDQNIEFTTTKKQVKKRRKWTQNKKKKTRAKYKLKQKLKKQEAIKSSVNKIKEENVVVNMSREDLPDSAYLFLGKGLGFVPTKKIDVHDLKYDTAEFIRKLSWKAFFKANPELQSDNDPSGTLHRDIKVSGFTSPVFNHPLLEEIKMKLNGWIANHVPQSPKSNLSILEIQGKIWLTEKINEKKLFVTKADKGGATLVMNYEDVQTAVRNELNKEDKFTQIQRTPEEQLAHVREEVRSLSIYLEQKKLIS